LTFHGWETSFRGVSELHSDRPTIRNTVIPLTVLHKDLLWQSKFLVSMDGIKSRDDFWFTRKSTSRRRVEEDPTRCSFANPYFVFLFFTFRFPDEDFTWERKALAEEPRLPLKPYSRIR
jgi:hypothetical protein